MARLNRQFTGFDGYQKAIAACDAVILATPPHFRPQHLRAAVDAGKHIFCEKPVAVDAAGVRSVLDTVKIAKDKNLTLVSGFCWRYSVRECDTYAKVHEGAIGDIRAVYTTYNSGGWVKPVERKTGWSEMEYQMVAGTITHGSRAITSPNKPATPSTRWPGR